MTALLAVTRAIHFASLMLIFGGGSYALLLRRWSLSELPRSGVRFLFTIAASLAIVTALAWLCLIAGQMSGDWHGSLDPGTIELTATATRFGRIFVVRIFGLLVLWLLCAFGRRPDRSAACVLAALLLASLGTVSHAAASGSNVVNLGAINDAAHLLTAGFWLGGLVVLAMFMRRNWADRNALIGALRVFSTWGTAAVALLVATGLVNAISILPMADMSSGDPYFRLLLVKVALALVMVGLASLNRWRLAPGLRAGRERARRYLTLSVASEIAIGSTIVAIVGFLGLMAPH